VAAARPATAKASVNKRVPGQDGDAFAKNLVVGQLAPAVIIVVHGRQIVMDERVSVDALDRAGQGQGVAPRTAAGFRRRQTEGRPQPFAAGKNGIAHGAVDRGGLGPAGGRKSSRARLTAAVHFLEITFQIKSRVCVRIGLIFLPGAVHQKETALRARSSARLGMASRSLLGRSLPARMKVRPCTLRLRLVLPLTGSRATTLAVRISVYSWGVRTSLVV
jgi:hypothetical protein